MVAPLRGRPRHGPHHHRQDGVAFRTSHGVFLLRGSLVLGTMWPPHTNTRKRRPPSRHYNRKVRAAKEESRNDDRGEKPRRPLHPPTRRYASLGGIVERP